MLGAGGMGEVYDAYDGELDRAIALKVLAPRAGGDATALTERLVRESRLMAKVVAPGGHRGPRRRPRWRRGVHRDGADPRRDPRRDTSRARPRPGARSPRSTSAPRAASPPRTPPASSTATSSPTTCSSSSVAIATQSRVVVTDFGIARLRGAPAPSRRPRSAHAGHVELTRPAPRSARRRTWRPSSSQASTVDARADVFAFCVSLWEGVFGSVRSAGQTIDEIRAALAVAPRAPHARRAGAGSCARSSAGSPAIPRPLADIGTLAARARRDRRPPPARGARRQCTRARRHRHRRRARDRAPGRRRPVRARARPARSRGRPAAHEAVRDALGGDSHVDVGRRT